MPRKTRATAKAEAASEHAPASQIDDAHLQTSPKHNREPLRSITPNSVHSEEPEQGRYEQMPAKRAKAQKKAKGGKKNKKLIADADQQSEPTQKVQELDENEGDIETSLAPQVAEEEAALKALNSMFTLSMIHCVGHL